MRCPDCGHTLTPIPLGVNGEANQSFRCYRCGGFWIEGWLVNRLSTKMLDKWPQTGVSRASGDDGKGGCPVHVGTKLERYTGDAVPSGIAVSKCRFCGWWWFPKNALFSFKPAQEAKVNYFKLWNMPTDLKGVMLPLLVLVVLILGGGVALQLIKQQQYTLLNASGVIKNVSLTYLGNGEAVVNFTSQVKLSTIEARQLGDTRWTTLTIDSIGGAYTLKLVNLQSNTIYEFRILGKVYQMVTR